MVAVRVRIAGRVQGVWYRGWAIDQAQARGLRGWVRNCRDGTVEALLIGAQAAIDSMIEACRRGPPAARVEQVSREPAADDGSTGFRQAPTV
ncbi:MAG TPA: acylphosphatase [Alphaproteobacteria bacterium]|nr:acylphosphatase [Alphaproteobacteria bacterium]